MHSPITYSEGMIPIENFIVESWLSSGCYLLLEYDPSIPVNDVNLNSANMMNIIRLAESRKLSQYILGIDIRRMYINNDVLYTEGWKMMNLGEIQHWLMNPILLFKEKFIINQGEYIPGDYNHLEEMKKDCCRTDIYDIDYHALRTCIGNYNDSDERCKHHFEQLIIKLRDQWKKIMDLNTLTIILKNDNIQYGTLVGAEHGINFNSIFGAGSIVFTTRDRAADQNGCLNLKDSYFPFV